MGDSSSDLESNNCESPWNDVCSMLGVDNHSSNINNNNVFHFPPINHEGLHIHSQIFPHSLHHFNPTASPSKIPVTPCWNLMHRSLTYVHSTLLNHSISKIISFLFLPPTALLLVLWYSRVRRQRQALQKQLSHDRLVRIVSQKDEEIKKLMRQIARMNKLLYGVATSSPSP